MKHLRLLTRWSVFALFVTSISILVYGGELGQPFPLKSSLPSLAGYNWKMDEDVLHFLESIRNAVSPLDYHFGQEVQNETISIVQGEFAVISENDSRFKFLSTGGAGPCIITILVDGEKGIVSLGHFDVLVNVSATIRLMIKKMRSLGAKSLQAMIYGAVPDNRILRYALTTLKESRVPVVDFARFDSATISSDGRLSNSFIMSDNLDFKERTANVNKKSQVNFTELKELLSRAGKINSEDAQNIALRYYESHAQEAVQVTFSSVEGLNTD